MTATIIKLQPVAESLGQLGLGRLLSRLVLQPLARLRAREAAFEELMSLDDHMLRDIGITRGQIPGVIKGLLAVRVASNENKPNVAA
jgi:uncharacterized protein YjiS (DUF1127 family)